MFARKHLARLYLLGTGAIHLRVGAGYDEWSEAAPFDVTVETVAPSRIP